MAAVKVAQLRPTKSSTIAVCNEESDQSPECAGNSQISLVRVLCRLELPHWDRSRVRDCRIVRNNHKMVICRDVDDRCPVVQTPSSWGGRLMQLHASHTALHSV